MIIVGIDVAKNKHDAIIIDSKGDTLTKSFRIANSHKGANTLIDRIKTVNPHNLPVMIGMELLAITGFLFTQGLFKKVLK